LFEIEISLAYIIDEDGSLDIFEMVVNTSKPTKELVNQELLIFHRYEVDAKNIKCFLEWWRKDKSMFPTIGFLVKQIIGIVGSQIEIEFVFLC
jgi:hypothetical protein